MNSLREEMRLIIGHELLKNMSTAYHYSQLQDDNVLDEDVWIMTDTIFDLLGIKPTEQDMTIDDLHIDVYKNR
jgi:hypothetical protein